MIINRQIYSPGSIKDKSAIKCQRNLKDSFELEKFVMIIARLNKNVSFVEILVPVENKVLLCRQLKLS